MSFSPGVERAEPLNSDQWAATLADRAHEDLEERLSHAGYKVEGV